MQRNFQVLGQTAVDMGSCANCREMRAIGTGNRFVESPIEYDVLDDALKRCGATWDAAQAHGLLSSRLAVAGVDGAFDWLSQVLDGAENGETARSECESMLNALYQSTHRQLRERLSDFTPLLPDDADSTAKRAAALGHWCEGFLHGLVSRTHGEDLRKALAGDPLADIIRDMLEITRAAPGDDDDEETDEAAYAEIVEYLRVAAQLAYEELAEFRTEPATSAADNDTIH